MVSDTFPRAKPSEACLSAFRVSQLALGLLRAEELAPAEGHLAACTHCRQRVEDERAGVRAAAYERVPEALLRAAESTPARPARPSWRPWTWGSALAASLAAAMVFLVVRPTSEEAPGERLKGGASLNVAVARSGTLIVNGMPAEEVEHLRAGDQLRLRVQGAQSAWIILEGDEESRWTTYFEGPVPQEGWLPMGITVTPEGKTRLRLLTCAVRPPAGVEAEEVCRQRVYTWGLEEAR